MTAAAPPADGVRVDVWLWAARFFRTRPLAKQAVLAGRVRIDGRPCRASRLLRSGERLEIVRGGERYAIEVLALADRRGPASAAQALYREDEASVAARALEREQRRLDAASVIRPPGKPGKHDRRKIRALNASRDQPLPPWFPR